MPHKSFVVSVEPDVLIWARKSIGMDFNDVAKKMKDITTNTLLEKSGFMNLLTYF